MYITLTIEPGLVGEMGIFPRGPGLGEIPWEVILCCGPWWNADWEAEEWNGDGVVEGENAIACMCCCGSGTTHLDILLTQHSIQCKNMYDVSQAVLVAQFGG